MNSLTQPSTSSSSKNSSRPQTEEQVGGLKNVGTKDRMLELGPPGVGTAASKVNITVPRGDPGSPAPQFPDRMPLPSAVIIRNPTVLTDDEVVKCQTMAPAYDRSIYHNLSNWISAITVVVAIGSPRLAVSLELKFAP